VRAGFACCGKATVTGEELERVVAQLMDDKRPQNAEALDRQRELSHVFEVVAHVVAISLILAMAISRVLIRWPP
jgi:hypothetical protein